MVKELNTLMQECSECPLARSREHVLPGEGSGQSEIVLVGDAPNAEEDSEGQTYIGQTGEALDQLLKLANLKRSDLFVTYLVKCRPLYDREPLPNEINTCYALWLDKQLKRIQPKLVITAGKSVTSKFLPGVRQLSAVHGRLFKKGMYYIFPTHSLNYFSDESRLKTEMEEDFSKLPEVLKHLNITLLTKN